MDYTLHAVVVAAYLIALIAVGAVKASSIKTQADFSLAGRGLSVFVLVGTLLATWIGTGSIFGNAEKTFKIGVPAFLIPISGAVGIVALFFLAAKVRDIGQFTIQDILEQRFGVWARVLGTLILLAAYIIIVSYQYRAGAAVIERILPDLPHVWAVIGVAAFVMTYTALAGMFSVAYTDVANGVLMVVGIGIALPILVMKAGGPSEMIHALPEGKRHLFGHFSLGELLSVLLPSFLLLLGDANMYQRFFAARDANSARKAALGMLVGVVLLECAIIGVAVAGTSLVAQGKLSAPENSGHIVVHLAFDALPGWLGAALVATVVAVVVSTADSYLLSPSTAVVRDLYQRFIAPEASDRSVVTVGRGVVIALGLIALGLAFTSDEFFDVALFAYTLYGAGITLPLMAALFWPRATPAGAVSSMIAGVSTAVIWKAFVADHFAGDIDAVLPAAAVSLLVLVIVSLLGARK